MEIMEINFEMPSVARGISRRDFFIYGLFFFMVLLRIFGSVMIREHSFGFHRVSWKFLGFLRVTFENLGFP